MKILSPGAELLHTDGRTDRRTGIRKLVVSFRIFANSPFNTQSFIYAASNSSVKKTRYIILNSKGLINYDVRGNSKQSFCN
jgi:hypothetical protein